MATSRELNLPQLLSDPGFTPSVKMLGGLLDLLGTDDDEGGAAATVKLVERAVLRIELQQGKRVMDKLTSTAKTAVRPARGRLTHLIGRFVQDARDSDHAGLDWLLTAVGDDDLKTRRVAARALGKASADLPTTRKEAIRSVLAEAFDKATNDDDQRAFAEALGKVGGEAARTRLAGGAHVRASLMVDRELARQTSGTIDASRTHDGPLRIWFHTRSGLEEVLKEELAEADGLSKPHFVAPGIVEAELAHKTPLTRAMEIRTATHLGFPLASAPKSKDFAVDVVSTIVSPIAMKIFYAFTSSASDKGLIRFRLEFKQGGHRRALVWRCAELVRSEMRDLINDPKSATWEVVVDEVGDQVKVELVPTGHVDERFAYREDLVAASSHPVIASALVRVAPRTADDIVWDPFVGAGAELIERARLGPYAKLIGTDIDAKALAAAKANVARARLAASTVTITEADASTFQAKGINVIITNPPMGRRVQRGGHADLLDRFVEHAAKVLVPGGSLVWLVPEPQRIRARAEAAKLTLARAFTVDMGGFSAELGVWVKSGVKAAPAHEQALPNEARPGAARSRIVRRPNRKR